MDPKQNIQYGPKAENTIWAQIRQIQYGQNQKIQYGPKPENTKYTRIRKYMRRQMLKLLAGHMMWGVLRPPPGGDSSCDPLVFPAFASASMFFFCLIMYFLLLPHRVFSVVAPYCMFSFVLFSAHLIFSDACLSASLCQISFRKMVMSIVGEPRN